MRLLFDSKFRLSAIAYIVLTVMLSGCATTVLTPKEEAGIGIESYKSLEFPATTLLVDPNSIDVTKSPDSLIAVFLTKMDSVNAIELSIVEAFTKNYPLDVVIK